MRLQERSVAPQERKRAGGDDPSRGSGGVEVVGLKSLLDAFEEESDDERKPAVLSHL